MEKYGTIFEPNFSLEKDKFRNLISEYYDNPNLQKIKDSDNNSIYAVMLENNLINNKYYIIATCIKDNNKIGVIKSLSHLNWNAFQTRNINLPNMISFTHETKQDKKFNITLKLFERTKKITKYITEEYPIYISLLHDNLNLYEYPNIGNLIAALDTYKTIITFK